ncbi:hypothetical protein MMA231_00895 [Asticcacaulis sp. MM231]|uniref:hypothetical protein n=1 Tax=Asticcacaulis sp. MM231 TaxID=3157666 RepID=UPI0032D59407
MRYQACLIVLATCLAFPALAQDNADVEALKAAVLQNADPDYHNLPLALDKSGKMLQHFTQTKTTTRGGITQSGTGTSDYSLAYSETDDGYRVTKTLLKFSISDVTDPAIKEGMNDPAAAKMMENLTSALSPLSYSADESLSPVLIEDWEGTKARVLKAMDELMTSGGASPQEAAQLKQAMAVVYDQLTPETATGMFLEADRMMGLPHNIGLSLKKPITASGQIQMPLGGQPVDAQESIALISWNDAGNTAHVSYDYAPTPESLKAYLTTFLPTFMKQAGAPAAAITELKTAMSSASPDDFMKVTTHCDYDMAIDTGVVTKGVCEKVVAMNFMGEKGGSTERLEFSESFVH